MTHQFKTAETTFPGDVYGLEDSAATQAFYRDWADSYDADLKANGYVSPTRCAEALARCAPDVGAPLLDVGCGTGLSGEAFAEAGFATVDGTDFSSEMLAVAERKDVYRRLIKGDLAKPLPAAPGAYANVAAVGVFSPGHAPPELIDQALSVLPSGGCFVFTLNDHALAERVYEGRLREVVDAGAADLLFKKHGPHLPGQGLRATVYVLQRR